MYVIGTAGHVDHGKSTLVHALTGINPDRLEEEQRREMTIDLGFAHLKLPGSTLVGMVDVPGHERFIKNMLAGVGGIDAALLIIAADEGVMPQTEEHLHILDLLGVEHGLVVLTKRDLVDDEWLNFVQEDVRARLQSTVFAQADMIPVSARTGAGLHELLAGIERMLGRTPSRTIARGTPRLPIDRVFTIGGFGTVVTGTLTDGPLAIGQDVVIQPGGLNSRVRGLQTHGAKTEQAMPGTRVAANLVGVSVDGLRRGDVVTLPGKLTPTTLIDMKLRLIADAPRPLQQSDLLDLHVHAAEVPCRVTLLEADHLRPGSEAWVQLRPDRLIAVARGDRCTVRVPTPSLTVGGGIVQDAHPPRHRRFRADVIAGLERLSRGTPAELMPHVFGNAPIERSAAIKASGLDRADAEAALRELHESVQVVALTPDASWLLTARAWDEVRATIVAVLTSYHSKHALRFGMPREELKSKLGLAQRPFDLVVRAAEAAGVITTTETTVRRADWSPRLNQTQQRQVERLLHEFRAAPFAPPARAEWESVGAELISYLIEGGQLARVHPDVLFDAAAWTKLVEWTLHKLETDGEISVAYLRDHWGTSRKYALAFLEHLDERKITRRVGDVRVKY